MGKKNPFAYRTKSVNFVLLVANLQGQIVHVMGNSAVIGATYRQLFLKNFFTDVLSSQSCQRLYHTFGSQQLMPSSISQSQFDCRLRIEKVVRQKQDRTHSQIFHANCLRIFVKFQKFTNFHNRTKILQVHSQFQMQQLINDKTIKQAILIQLRPSTISKLHEEVDEGSQISSSNAKQEEVMMIVSPEKISNNDCFGTPLKSKRIIQRSTQKVYEELSKEQQE